MDTNLFLDSLKQLLPGEGNPAVRRLRQEALTNALKSGPPHPKTPSWKYALLEDLFKHPFEPYRDFSPTISLEEITPYLFEKNTTALIFINGTFCSHLSSPLPYFHSLADMPADFLIDVLEKSNHASGFFQQLNTAFMTDGAFILIPENHEISVPIVIYHFLTEKNHTNQFISPQTHVILEAKAKATVIERIISLTENPAWLNAQTFIQCYPDSHLNYYYLHQESHLTYSFNHTRAQMFGGSINYVAMQGGAEYHRQEVHFELLKPHSEVLCHALIYPYGHQHADWVTHLTHALGFCRSLQKIKGIVGEEGHSSFLGQILIKQDAQKSVAKMTNHNLLLSEHARADTSPQLEVLADDVQCNHGSAVGQLDKEALFYLESRGLDPTLAMQLLTYAFAEEILEAIDDPFIKEVFLRLLKARLIELWEVDHA